MQIKIVKNKIINILGIISIVLGIVIYAIPFINEHNHNIEEENYINEYIDETKIDEETEIKEEINNNSNSDDNDNKHSIKNYLMILDIPKINLKKGIYDIESIYNSVDYGIQIMKESSMPEFENSNVILASHRGTSNISYFDKLDRLINGDKVNLLYNGNKYTYQIIKSYEQEKTGKITLLKYDNKSIITLITCKKNENKQIVYVGILESKEMY